MAKTVAELVVERLISWGVDTVFGLPGDGINGLFEALRAHQDQVQFIQVRHEEAAAFAACGYAKYTGRLGVCMATSGPGGIHLLNGLYDAKLDGQPVLAITGHTFHDLIGTHYQQDVDLDKLFIDVAAYNQRLMGPMHVHGAVDEAIKTALSRRTVAHITIPKDMQEWTENDPEHSKGNIPQHSIGAAVAYPGRQVVCIIGDGGFTMLMGEVATLVKYNLPVKVIIIKNNVLGMIKWEQIVFEGNPQFGVELQPIDFSAFAKACGAAGYTIEKPEEAAAVLRDALAHPGPAVIEAVVDPTEPPMPGKVTTAPAWHFVEALARGQEDRWDILKMIAKNTVREVI